MDFRIVWVHGIGINNPGYSLEWQNTFNPYFNLKPENYLEVCWDPVLTGASRGAVRVEETAATLTEAMPLTPEEQQDADEIREQLQAILLARSSALVEPTATAARGEGPDIVAWSDLTGSQDLEDAAARGFGLPTWLTQPDAYLGDFIKYLASPRIRNAIKEKFKEQLRPLAGQDFSITVISHSWGTVVAYDSLLDLAAELPGLKVANHFTLGSPLWLVRWLLDDKSGRKPDQLANWVNIHAKGDLVGSWLSPAFKVDKEFEVLNFGGHDAHGSYFENGNVAVQRDLIANTVLGVVREIAALVGLGQPTAEANNLKTLASSTIPTPPFYNTGHPAVVPKTAPVENLTSPNLHALLIGVDCYQPNRLSDGSFYPSLRGCVRDISHVEEFLKRKMGMQDSQISKLTASNGNGSQPVEPPEAWPTYVNIVKAFRSVKDNAKPGDQVYIHYSGHGGRATTLIPDRKGPDGHDEALVPTDIGNSEANYLRDIELGKLLGEMVEKGLIVTVVLDSCHSGGATRGGNDIAVRGLNVIDTTPRPQESLVASKEELTQEWEKMTAGSPGATRNVSAGSGWLPETKGYTLLAACLETESAYEFAFENNERNGALTYWLLKSMEEINPNNPGVSYKMVQDKLLAKIHSQFEKQTPQLQGEGDRVIFGSDRLQPQYAVGVLQVNGSGSDQRLLLGAGQVHGIREGAQFVIYPPGTADLSRVEDRQALVTIVQRGSDTSWASVITDFKKTPIEQGSQAVLVNPGSVKLVRKVGLVTQDKDPANPSKPFPLSLSDQATALSLISQSLAGNSWVEEVKDGETSDYNVAVSGQGCYEIWDRAGILVNLRPEIGVGNTTAEKSRAAQGIVDRLVHLTKYQATLELDNNDALSPLAGKLKVELTGWQANYDPADKPEPQPFADPGNTPVLETGQWTFVKITNNSPQILKLAVLDLQPDYGISQVYPVGVETFALLEPGHNLEIPLEAFLPGDYCEGRDIIKVLATLNGTDFHWLEMPSLDKTLAPKSATRGEPLSPLEQLQLAIAGPKPPTRNLNPAAYPSKEWVVAQLEVRMKKAG